MGATKRLIEKYEEQERAAIQIAIQAGALKHCDLHSGYISRGDAEIEDAYKLGNYKFTKGELKDSFDDRREMTDAIKKVVQNCAFECNLCAKMREE
ncbi:MAG: hypothetical protein WB780_02795 [Candidatus Acidiferrales bacterium]